MQYTSRWSELATKIKPSVQAGIKQVAARYQSNIRAFAPRLSGWMADNVYVSTWDESDYGSGGSPSNTSAYLLDEVKPETDTSAIVGAAANYSIFTEMGHRTRSGSFVPANPWFVPGVEATRGDVEAIMAQALAEGLA